jgi:hypothetical protein
MVENAPEVFFRSNNSCPLRDFSFRDFGTLSFLTSALQDFETFSFTTLALRDFGLRSFAGGETPEVKLPE